MCRWFKHFLFAFQHVRMNWQPLSRTPMCTLSDWSFALREAATCLPATQLTTYLQH